MFSLKLKNDDEKWGQYLFLYADSPHDMWLRKEHERYVEHTVAQQDLQDDDLPTHVIITEV